MAGTTRLFLLAVKRDLRGEVPADWQTRIQNLPDVLVGSVSSPHRMQIEAGPLGVKRIDDEFGEFLHIETIQAREKSEP